MKRSFQNPITKGELHLIENDPHFDRLFYQRDRKNKFLTIAWNKGPLQRVTIDHSTFEIPANSFLPLMVNQSFSFEKPESIIAWQFNRDFYCIVNHDKEVGCVGFLFYGSSGNLFLQLDEKEEKKIGLLLEVFKDEFDTSDQIQEDMLRVLLVRLIITLTRIAKLQYLPAGEVDDQKFDLVRKFNLLVENHYKIHHDVKFYADQLHKSPKTLSNAFAIYGNKSPLLVIQDRVILEAKRLFYYTDKSAKEVASELGFEDAAHFSKFFKNQTSVNPTDFKKSLQIRQ
jgi:AraC family transcriptional regulator, transcriptional activator of pobA